MSLGRSRSSARIERVDVAAYTIPTERPESDGTLEWDSTTVVVVRLHGGGTSGIGYTYADPSCATLIRGKLAPVVEGKDALQTGDVWDAVVGVTRNLGRPGLAGTAASAVDIAAWDLKGRILGAPVVALVPAHRREVAVYGSGGFCSYTQEELQSQLAGWVADGIGSVKMKVGREPGRDVARVDAARDAIGPDVDLLVDGNGAYTRKQALAWADRFAEHGVVWFEEPVTSDDLEGLRLLRDRGPAGMDIAAGEYGYDLTYFRAMLAAGAVDCLQADVTRCGGITGFLRVGALCDAHTIDLSAHTAPQASAHACTGIWHFRHVEYFHDHARIEAMLFDGALRPQAGGLLIPDGGRPGLGVELKEQDAEQWAA